MDTKGRERDPSVSAPLCRSSRHLTQTHIAEVLIVALTLTQREKERVFTPRHDSKPEFFFQVNVNYIMS
jgi:hypothetical protein